MKYLTFIRHSESYRESPPPAALMEAMGKFVEKSFKDGTVVDTGGLLPSKDGARVRLSNGEITVTDGPFTESKEVIGGWPSSMRNRRPTPSASRKSSWSFTESTGPGSRASPRCARCSIPAWGRKFSVRWRPDEARCGR